MVFPKRILTPAEVYEIRAFKDEGWTKIPGNWKAIALAYGITYSYAKGIGGRHNRWWLPEN